MKLNKFKAPFYDKVESKPITITLDHQGGPYKERSRNLGEMRYASRRKLKTRPLTANTKATDKDTPFETPYQSRMNENLRIS